MALINYITEIRFGAKSVNELNDVCKIQRIHKPLIVTDKGVEAAGIIDKVISVIGHNSYTIYNDTPSNPNEFAVREGVVSLLNHECDGVIAVGGGSSIDLAKAIAVSARHDGPLKQFALIEGGLQKITSNTLPIIAIPTTAGTGSEVGH